LGSGLDNWHLFVHAEPCQPGQLTSIVRNSGNEKRKNLGLTDLVVILGSDLSFVSQLRPSRAKFDTYETENVFCLFREA
jgi:hypothetical protein